MSFLPLIAVLEYHNMDPEIFRIGPFALRWYSLAYIGGILLGWWWGVKLARKWNAPYSVQQIGDFMLWATLGVILGGRIGYVLFYNFGYYLENPGEILMVWQGGMSFHGGLLGVIGAIFLFTRYHKIDIFRFSDYVACFVPIGLFFGRVANFINGELWGAPSDLPWAMPFPGGGDVPRHPSQLYEAFLEGILLFLVLNYMVRRGFSQKFPGIIVGMFFVGYGAFRYLIEFVRVPDAHLGKIWGAISMGQLLSLPMILFGLFLVVRAVRQGKPKTDTNE